ncbi:MAG: single-stranded DNA-binding protein [Clostridiales bacterium]|nr:single-stranded DNA-binding protein [Clostridiales bacterium]
MYDVNEMLIQAVNETKNLHVGETFLVRELFLGYRWNRIPHKDRLLLGILFLNHVNSTRCELHAIEKTPSNQQRYRKIKD